MNAGRRQWELLPEQVRRATDPTSLDFETTASLPPPPLMVGQSRAAEAIDFALDIADQRYNLYAAGRPGTGRLAAVVAAAERIARERPPTSDWCYVHNFEHPTHPRALALPAGNGRGFSHDVDAFVLACRRELRRAFADATYLQQREDLLREIESRHGELLEELQQQALAQGFAIQGTPSGLIVVPLKPARSAPVLADQPTPPATEGETNSADAADTEEPRALSREEFDALPAEEQQRLRELHDEIQALIDRTLPEIRALEDRARARIRRLDRVVAEKAIAHLADDLATRYSAFSTVAGFLQQLRDDMVAHADVLRGEDDADSREEQDGAIPDEAMPADEGDAEDQEDALGTLSTTDDARRGPGVPLDEDLRVRPGISSLLRRYKVNPLVRQPSESHVPVVQEINPTHLNLLGRIEIGLRDGLPYTDHMMIRPGALHRANGGFLIVQAGDLLSHPGAWDVVKRMLRFGVIAVETSQVSIGVPASASLRPEPIPARVKVIFVGDTETYALLLDRDPEFRQLFKVRADFDADMPRAPETERYYAMFAGDVARRAQGPALSAAAVALLIEEGSRWADDQTRLSTQLSTIGDLTVESCYWARKEGAPLTEHSHMQRAITARERRLSLVSDRMDDLITQGTLMIDTEGQVVGQVNGLTVLTVAEYAFGKPVRITARTSPGWAGVVTIERETDMSGPSHTKGVLILNGYLTGRFAQEFPLSLSASLCFEQTYDEVDGDSASSAELYALLSSLSGVPIRQSIAVTGSVNQRGEVQAVGGVTQKIEGFYKICKARGLTGEQGIIIPRANVRNLMLREEIAEAIRHGHFHIFAINTIDEGIELLTGITAGHPDPYGRYLEGTIHARLMQSLRSYHERVRASGLIAVPTGRPTG